MSAETSVPKPPKKIGRPRKPATANDVLRLAERLDEKERDKLRRYGARIPEGTADLDDPSSSIWGLRCKHCNKVALRFLGTSWFGQPVPPAGMKLRDLSWTQDLIDPDPRRPNCQHCGAGPSLGVGGGILPPGPPHFGIVKVDGWEEKLAKLYSPEEAARIRLEIGKMGGSLHETSQSFEARETTTQDQIEKVAQESGQPAGRATAVMESIADQGGLNAAADGGMGVSRG